MLVGEIPPDPTEAGFVGGPVVVRGRALAHVRTARSVYGVERPVVGPVGERGGERRHLKYLLSQGMWLACRWLMTEASMIGTS